MKHSIHIITKTTMLLLATVFLQSYSVKSGGDHYRIFLNDKLVLEHFVTMPQKAKALSLNGANQNDQLTIHYSHCGVSGKGRSIALKNENGKVLKEWKFADSKGTGMKLTVKELLQTAGKSGTASIYYTSKEIPSGKMLTTINPGKTATAKLSK